MNVAQSKVELMRDLPYQLITQEFLNGDSPAAQNAGIGTTWTSDDGKVYDITYTVTKVVREQEESEWVLTEYPTADGQDIPDGDESFKMVTVDVVWQGPPSPSHHAILKTAVYRRFAGPEISRLGVSPLSTLPSGRVGIYAPNGPVWMTAEISPYDWSETSFITFTVEGPNGQPVFEQAVPVDTTQAPIVGCQWQWTDGPTMACTSSSRSQPTRETKRATSGPSGSLGQGPPPAPTNVVVIREEPLRSSSGIDPMRATLRGTRRSETRLRGDRPQTPRRLGATCPSGPWLRRAKESSSPPRWSIGRSQPTLPTNTSPGQGTCRVSASTRHRVP